jgi:hypothetical protein
MLLRGSIAAIAFAVSALTGLPIARADEAYVCDAGTVVYVKPGQLEAMKRSDPCIASYYGITLPSQAAAAQPAPLAPASTVTPPVEFKTLGGPDDHADASKRSSMRTAQAAPAAHRPPPVAAPGTDFRNIRLINAAPESDGWYRHNL